MLLDKAETKERGMGGGSGKGAQRVVLAVGATAAAAAAAERMMAKWQSDVARLPC